MSLELATFAEEGKSSLCYVGPVTTWRGEAGEEAGREAAAGRMQENTAQIMGTRLGGYGLLCDRGLVNTF